MEKMVLAEEYVKQDNNSNQVNNFNNYNNCVTSVWFSDDPIANNVTVSKLTSLFKKSSMNIIQIRPTDLRLTKIGHTAFLSKKYKGPIWKVIHHYLSDMKYKKFGAPA